MVSEALGHLPGPPRLVTSRTLANPRSPTRRGPKPGDVRMWAGRPSLQVAAGWGGAGSGPLAWSQFRRLSLESAINARGAPRSTGCLVLASADCRGASRTRGKQLCFLQKPKFGPPKNPECVFSTGLEGNVLLQRTSSCVLLTNIFTTIWLEFMLYDLKMANCCFVCWV